MTVRVSLHAVDRYVERIDPSASFNEARMRIEAAMASAARLKERTHAGDAMYRADGFRMVVAIERNHFEVLTVLLPDDSDATESDVPEVAEALHAEFRAWEESQPERTGHLTDKAARLQETIVQLQNGVRRRQKTIEALLSEREKWKDRVSRKKYEAQVAHAKRMESDGLAMRDALKTVAVRLLAGQPRAEVIRVIQEREPGLVSYLLKAMSRQGDVVGEGSAYEYQEPGQPQ